MPLNMTGIKRASPYIAYGTGFLGIGAALYYWFVERGYQKDMPEPTIPSQPGTPESVSSDSVMAQSSFSSSSSSSNGSFSGHYLAHLPLEVWMFVAVALAVLAIGYQRCVNQQKAIPRMTGR